MAMFHDVKRVEYRLQQEIRDNKFRYEMINRL